VALHGVLGDVHGNREALAAVLAFFNRRSAARLLCVGDIVGYNADADACAALLRARGALAVAGNHDWIGIGRLGFARCSLPAEYALRRTRRRLARDTADYLRALPAQRALEGGVLLVHGSVQDMERRLATPAEALADAALLRAAYPAVRLCFFGHLHAQKVYEIDGGAARELPAAAEVRLRPDRLYYVNPGAVDGARKPGARLAECALYDDAAGTLEFQRLAYDHDAAEAKAVAGGYRIGPWMNRYYFLRRRIGRKLMVRRD